tara:strand:+ start:467 stop:1237 length:771 start_codon:yes stop_codon:yes gene_type:complete
MSQDSVDTMIEDWASGLAGSTRVSAEAAGEMGIALGKVTPLEAARSVQEAIKAHTGRRCKVDSWRGAAAQALGFKRLSKKRWEEVLAVGVEAGLFLVDSDTLSYPVLVPLDPIPDTEVESDFDVEVADSRSVERERKRKVVVDNDVPPSSDPPANWNPPHTLSCGHVNWRTDEENSVAQDDGKCCANTGVYQWRVRGLSHPVPLHSRRSAERADHSGFPGLCCDPESGLYIGGLANDCRHYHDGAERCVVHARSVQ